MVEVIQTDKYLILQYVEGWIACYMFLNGFAIPKMRKSVKLKSFVLLIQFDYSCTNKTRTKNMLVNTYITFRQSI